MKQDASKENFGLGEPYDNFSQLLKTVRKNAGFSAQKIAAETGVHTNSQSHYENKQRDPNIDYLVKYSCVVGVPFWQLLSRRVELGSAPQQDKQSVLNEVGPLIKHFAERYQGYPVTEPGSQYNQADSRSPTYKLMAACHSLLDRYQAKEHFDVLRLDGNSMAPTISDGDDMIVDTSSEVLTEGDIFVFKQGEVYTAKRVQLLPGGGVMLVPDNSQYRSVTYSKDDIESLEVVGKLISSISHY